MEGSRAGIRERSTAGTCTGLVRGRGFMILLRIGGVGAEGKTVRGEGRLGGQDGVRGAGRLGMSQLR